MYSRSFFDRSNDISDILQRDARRTIFSINWKSCRSCRVLKIGFREISRYFVLADMSYHSLFSLKSFFDLEEGEILPNHMNYMRRKYHINVEVFHFSATCYMENAQSWHGHQSKNSSVLTYMLAVWESKVLDVLQT